LEVVADFKAQAQFGNLIRHRERAAGLRLDATQTMPDSIGMTEELCCGIGDRALLAAHARKVWNSMPFQHWTDRRIDTG
jgi:hypothetical protein